MSTPKRYYWIKLRESFMTSETMDFLMSQKNGANYVVLYQMLCLKTINTGGRLAATIGEYLIPYDVDKIQRDCKWFSVDTIRVALNLYKGLGLIYEDVDGTLILAEHESMVGSETNWAVQKRNQRNGQPALPEGGQCPPECPPDCPQDVPENVHPDIRYKDIRDKRLDTRYKEIGVGDEVVCAEPPDSGRSTPPTEHHPTPSEFEIPLADGTTYNVPVENIEVYKKLYPGVDVEQALRNMIGWSMNAGSQRKTQRGVKRFITNWLARDQDRGMTRRRDNQPKPYADEDDFYHG